MKRMVKNIRMYGAFVGAFVITFAFALPATAQLPLPEKQEQFMSEAYTGKSYSPYAGRGFPSRPLWGDTHLHTGNSFDAGSFGCRLQPEDAYRFARGEEMVSSTTTYAPEGSPNPRDLWKWLARYEERTGGDILALAHNGNLSNGIMFPFMAQWEATKLDKE